MTIAAVSYLNTVPMLYGIERAAKGLRAELVLSPPAGCAEAFKRNQADIALVPVGALPQMEDAHIITDFCIGASGPVRTVVLMSNQPLNQINRILLDPHSRTSAQLARLLCKHLWRIDPAFEPLRQPETNDALMLIGDKVFEHEGRFAHTLDLAVEWQRLTSLPFVFAVWVARQKVPPSVVAQLQKALEWGVEHTAEAIEHYGHAGREYALSYLTENIDYRFDAKKKEALNLFKEMSDDYDIHAPTQQHSAAERREDARGAGL